MLAIPDSNDFNFSDYQDNIHKSQAIPHCQMIAPKDRSLPFGFFIPLDKAAQVEFSLEAPGWSRHLHDFGEQEVDGFLSDRTEVSRNTYLSEWIKLVLVRNTKVLAFAPNESGKPRAVGECFSRDGLTEWGDLVAQNSGNPNYFRATRHLLYFLNENNQPLHSYPLQFKAKGGFGGSFGSELRFFYQESDRSAFDGALGNNAKFDDETRALFVFAFRLGVRQGVLASGQKGALYCYIAERLVPTCKPEMVGKELVQTRKVGGDVKLVGADWRSLMISKKSEFGLQIRSDFAEHEGFGEIRQERVEQKVEVVDPDEFPNNDYGIQPPDYIPY